jgi:hypothetical protein
MVGMDPVGAIAGTSPRTPASPRRLLRTSRPCRPCHGMCCAAGEGVCTYSPSEERSPRGTGLGEAPHAALCDHAPRHTPADSKISSRGR